MQYFSQSPWVLDEQVQIMDEKGKDILGTLGTVLVVLGVAVWGIYAVLRWGMARDVTGGQFLPYHLAGVVPGMVLRRRRFLSDIIRRLFS